MLIVRYVAYQSIERRVAQSRSLESCMIENSSKHDIARRVAPSRRVSSYLRNIGRCFQLPTNAWCIGFPRVFARFEIKTSLKDQGEVGSNNFDPRTPCEKYLSININLRGSTHYAENYIIAMRKHMDWNIIWIIGNSLNQLRFYCDNM